MIRGPLSEIAYKALTVVRKRSERQGLDFFEELNRVGLVATEPRIREIERSALNDLLWKYQNIDISTLMARYRQGNSNPPTASDIYQAVEAWIQSHVDKT